MNKMIRKMQFSAGIMLYFACLASAQTWTKLNSASPFSDYPTGTSSSVQYRIVIGTWTAPSTATQLYTLSQATNVIPLVVNTPSGPTVDIARFQNNGTNQFVINNSGSVGLGMGTSTISSKLQINGNAAIGYTGTTSAPTNGLYVSGTVALGTTTYDASCRLNVTSTTYPTVQIGPRWLTGTAQPYYMLGLNNTQTSGTTDCILNMCSQAGQTGIEFFRAGQQKWYIHNRPNDGAGHLDRLDFYNTTSRMTLDQDGTLRVPYKIRAGEVVVTTNVWADHVFKDSYNLKPLDKIAEYVKKNRHLEGIPTESEVKNNGVSVGEIQAKLLEKVEELTLHMIAMKKENDDLKIKVGELEKRMAK